MFGRISTSQLKLGTKALRMASTMSGKKLDGKVAVVTASTEGIGYAIAKRLGQDGARVVISSRNQKKVDDALKNLKAENIDVMGMVCHVGKADNRKKLIKETVERYGGIDILVSNAAANPHFGPILDCSEETWDKIFDTNVKASFFLCKEAIPHMDKRGGGSIIFVSSITGYVPFEFIAPYSVSKTTLLGLVKAMTPQCASMNIRVNGIAPGLIKTNFSTAITETPAIAEESLKNIPLKRFGKPMDCAGTVSFLASDDSDYITGETILITGGMQSRL